MRSLVTLVLIFSLLALPMGVLAETKEERKARLEADLQAIEREMLKTQVIVEDKQHERQSLERDIAILDAEINKAQLGIQARSVSIAQLSDEIEDKGALVIELQDRMEKQRASLAEQIRLMHAVDDFSFAEVMLSRESLSSFFEDFEKYQTIKVSLNNSVNVLQEIENDTVEEKQNLELSVEEEARLKVAQESEKRAIEAREDQKQEVLTATRGEEDLYVQILQQQKKSASEIRTQLFELRDSGAIPFGEALQLAKNAGARTGVRPAVILGILTQETKLGENIGVAGVWSSDMHPERDQPVFEVIADTIGFNPDTQPVSRAPGYGWGGAMGPSQFIPSTWAIYGGYINSVTGQNKWGPGYTGTWSYDAGGDVIRVLLGKNSPSNPYENQDAFMATALLMRDNGADGGTYASERLAALRYFAGWAGAKNPSYAFYGDGVMAHATRIQEEIDILEGN